MQLPNVMMVAGDTSRSRCYLQALCARGIHPQVLLILPSRQHRPGQVGNASAQFTTIECSWGTFQPDVSVVTTAELNKINFDYSPSDDINSKETIEAVRVLPTEFCIYSGFGGVLLRNDILNCGKKFLHVHGGWLPEYKGSTTNHYSALEKRFCGASSIFMSSAIDEGEILVRKKFPPPQNLLLLDHIYDALYRSEVLLETIEYYAANNIWPHSGEKNIKTEHFYIMHPVLRHVLILRDG